MQSTPIIQGPLSQVFNKTTASYKYLLFKSIMDAVGLTDSTQPAQNPISERDLYIYFLVNAWYPVTHFHLSFGKYDSIPDLIENIRKNNKDEEFDLSVSSIDYSTLNQFFTKHANDDAIHNLFITLERYVIYRFLVPWIEDSYAESEKHKRIAEYAEKDLELPASKRKLPYHFIYKDQRRHIQISENFESFLRMHTTIILDWWRWNFARYLARHNPLAPAIMDKLERPETRKLTHAREFWNRILAANQNMPCIYSGEVLGQNFDIDHFIPWSFVGHDLLWNLIPVSPSANRQKSDRLPSLEYLEPFLKTQSCALDIFSQRYIPDTLRHDFRVESIAKAKDSFLIHTYENYELTQNKNLLQLFTEDRGGEFNTVLEGQIKYNHANALLQGFKSWRYLKT